MAESLDKFMEVIFKDSALQSEIGAAGGRQQMIDTALKLGASRGYQFSAADFSAKLDSLEKSSGGAAALSDAELGAVAGGRTSRPTFTGPSYGSSTLCTFCSSSNGGKTFNQ
jgi:hypothetical protein